MNHLQVPRVLPPEAGPRRAALKENKTMKLPMIATTAAAILSLAACETTNSRTVIAGGTGAALGALTAEALADDQAWTLVGALAGAAAGTVVARSMEDERNCAYAVGDGTYRVAPCPA
jgi:hypothetical protein